MGQAGDFAWPLVLAVESALSISLAIGCVPGQVEGGNQSAPGSGSGSSDEPSPPVPAPRVVLPEMFTDGVFEADLPAPPNGTTYLIAAPSFTAPAASIELAVQATPATSTPNTLSAGSPVPAFAIAPTPDWGSPPAVGATTALPATRSFSIYSRTRAAYVSISARLAYAGASYAFYEDAANTANFTQGEYATLGGVLDSWAPAIATRFGAPTDLDGNGRRIVVLSRTAALERPDGGQAYVDGCNVSAQSAGCGGSGEIIYMNSIDTCLGTCWGNAPRDFYVTDYYPRTILHETVHLAQFAAGYRIGGSYAQSAAPTYLLEGTADDSRFIDDIGIADKWSQIASAVQAHGASPASDPYGLGSVVPRWLEGQVGPGVYAALLHSFVMPPSDGDYVASAVGVREGLAIALAMLALRFDGADWLDREGLALPSDPTTRAVPWPATLEVSADGATATQTLRYTQPAIVAIRATGPVHVRIAAPAPGAFVVIAQP